ncbi:MAG: Fic family protein [Verrucomicrobiales bacterium]
MPTNEMLRLIAGIDEFKGEWRAMDSLGPEKLRSLRRIATIESVGSSTRIEGARLSDEEVERLLGNLQADSFQSRDEQEVGGYAHAVSTVQTAWRDLPLTEGILLQLHRDLLSYSVKDERHRGGWKALPNHVTAFDADGNEIGIIFETAAPFDTPRLMEELLAWHAKEERESDLHPLLRIAVFQVVFLAIHPFQDGNGRLSRVLTNLQLLRAGYAHVSYSSLESVVEHNKEAYYLALRRTQTSFRDDEADWEPWLLFFLRAMRSQIERLRERLAELPESTAPVHQSPPGELSPLAGKLLAVLNNRDTLSVAEAVEALGANRNTLKGKFAELVEGGFAELHGKGRGAHYRPAKR